MLNIRRKLVPEPKRLHLPKRYDRTTTALVAVLTRSRTTYLLAAVHRVTPATIQAAVHARYPMAEVEAWVEVGTLADGIDAALCEAFGLADAEQLY